MGRGTLTIEYSGKETREMFKTAKRMGKIVARDLMQKETEADIGEIIIFMMMYNPYVSERCRAEYIEGASAYLNAESCRANRIMNEGGQVF